MLCNKAWPAVVQILQKVLDGVEVLALCRPVKVFHTKLRKLFLFKACFIHRDMQKDFVQTVATKLEAYCGLKYHCMLWHKIKKIHRILAIYCIKATQTSQKHVSKGSSNTVLTFKKTNGAKNYNIFEKY